MSLTNSIIVAWPTTHWRKNIYHNNQTKIEHKYCDKIYMIIFLFVNI